MLNIVYMYIGPYILIYIQSHLFFCKNNTLFVNLSHFNTSNLIPHACPRKAFHIILEMNLVEQSQADEGCTENIDYINEDAY